VAEVVLDSSAILALLFGEPGAETVRKMLVGACVSAVNAAETAGRLQLAGMSSTESYEALMCLGLEIVPFDVVTAWAAADLQPQTQKLGLSLGDRACLATAQQMRLPAVTADGQWLKLKLGIRVFGIR
jgi:ribonuclease VapC